VLWELSKDILKKDILGGKKPPGMITPLNTQNVYNEEYLSQGWTPVLMGASGRTDPLFKRMLKHERVCHRDPNLMSGPTMNSLDTIDKAV
jgi:hypothetical protein